MKIGIIGLGMVGGTLKKWFDNHMNHEIVVKDPAKGYDQDFTDVMAVFICIPVNPSNEGQDQTELEKCVKFAKQYTPNVFIRSTVLPGTNDRLDTIACPEFLTARRAYEDMCKLPIVVGSCWIILKEIFGSKEIVKLSNYEAELAKYGHNCFGALKVTYFNMLKDLCEKNKADFEKVKRGMFLTGFIEKEHTQVPGPDGFYGYGGTCFPPNMESFGLWLYAQKMRQECALIQVAHNLNQNYRNKTKDIEGAAV